MIPHEESIVKRRVGIFAAFDTPRKDIEHGARIIPPTSLDGGIRHEVQTIVPFSLVYSILAELLVGAAA